MTGFWIVSALFVAGALALVLPPLLVPRARPGLSQNASNLAIYRDQSRELDAELAAGGLDAGQHAKARRELEARLLEDVADGNAASAAPRRRRGAAIVAGLAIPLGALALYFTVGNPQAIVPQAASQHAAAGGVYTGPLEGLVARLATRMKENPDDPEGWKLLGRSYGALGRFDQAAQAYANAAARAPGDAGLLADYAEIIAMAQGGRLQGEPEMIIGRALEADPANLKAHALAGTAAFGKEDYAGAIRHWERILPLVPAQSENARAIQASIAEARSLGGAMR
jgi:cytochrome c-type biogenesis protein CcmH